LKERIKMSDVKVVLFIIFFSTVFFGLLGMIANTESQLDRDEFGNINETADFDDSKIGFFDTLDNLLDFPSQLPFWLNVFWFAPLGIILVFMGARYLRGQ
jgi:ABC-type transport system involved in multi-copper enzyme maturation permease subunit